MKVQIPGSAKPHVQAEELGIPAWITNELIEATIETWQPFYSNQLTTTDAVKILVFVGEMIDVTTEPDVAQGD